MIYLDNTAERQTLRIPRNGREAEGHVHFKAWNTTSLSGFSFPAEETEVSPLYHTISVSLNEKVQQGEYEYTFSDESGVLSTGLLVIGSLEDVVEYENITEYEQYNAD